jgi:hypothetical protein
VRLDRGEPTDDESSEADLMGVPLGDGLVKLSEGRGVAGGGVGEGVADEGVLREGAAGDVAASKVGLDLAEGCDACAGDQDVAEWGPDVTVGAGAETADAGDAVGDIGRVGVNGDGGVEREGP